MMRRWRRRERAIDDRATHAIETLDRALAALRAEQAAQRAAISALRAEQAAQRESIEALRLDVERRR